MPTPCVRAQPQRFRRFLHSDDAGGSTGATFGGKALSSSESMACPEGLEPPTYCLEGNCSIRLSYGQVDVEKAAWGQAVHAQTPCSRQPRGGE